MLRKNMTGDEQHEKILIKNFNLLKPSGNFTYD
jgi:hypothetical protein